MEPNIKVENEAEDIKPVIDTVSSNSLTEPSSSTRKRRRIDITTKTEEEYDNEDNVVDTTSPPAELQATQVKTKLPRTRTTANRRGRQPAGAAFTPAHDAYLVHLRQSSSSSHDIWLRFEEKFQTGRNEKALKNRWFAIKDAVMLTGEEEAALRQTIDEVLGDIAGTIVEGFKTKTGKKVTKAYVQQKVKEMGVVTELAKLGVRDAED
ncbi:hypothetical protein DRE_02754 [Drechslerella stenobrocha 248]|uniref:Myb-like domain-containing protein n=1 Tax=Drechslerella stenobrocha 248 TaxID=1043628 RepID=W7I5X1_9PEZI|nr:hypothetical protein DRE_02754 [Drechslerella stenobrocha 248]